jgi:hypothetical protein
VAGPKSVPGIGKEPGNDAQVELTGTESLMAGTLHPFNFNPNSLEYFGRFNQRPTQDSGPYFGHVVNPSLDAQRCFLNGFLGAPRR